MNANIRTMRRVRHTHTKFAALGLATAPAGGNEDGVEGEGGGGGIVTGITLPTPLEDDGAGIGVDDDKIDERPWSVRVKAKGRAEGVEIGEECASDCLTWMGSKVLEHAGFQGRSSFSLTIEVTQFPPFSGTSKVALDVLASVTSEYLLNVGRTIRYLSDKYANTMTAEVCSSAEIPKCG